MGVQPQVWSTYRSHEIIPNLLGWLPVTLKQCYFSHSAGSMGLPFVWVALWSVWLPDQPWDLPSSCPLGSFRKDVVALSCHGLQQLWPPREKCSQKGLGESVTRWMFLGYMGILHAKAGFSDTCCGQVWMAPKSRPETPCSSFQAWWLQSAHYFSYVPNRMWFCTSSDYTGASWLSVFGIFCIFLLERWLPFSISQNFLHSPCSGDFLNAFCFLRMFWYHNPELPLCCQLLLSIVAALVAVSCSNEWFSLPIRLGWCQRYLWPGRGTCAIAKRYSRGCQESSSITARLGSLLAILSAMICPKSPTEYVYNDLSSPTV